MTPAVKAPVNTSRETPVYVLMLLVFAFFLYFFALGSYPLLDVDEPRYAEAAREMIERNNWVTPYFNYELRFDKPIFFYWMVAGAYKLLGVSEFSARLWSAITATLSVLMVYFFGARLITPRFGLFAALILATSAEFVGLARMSVTDMTLATLMTGTTLSLFLVSARSTRWWLVAGVFSGLAILTKGPVGIIVPGAIFTLYALLTGEAKRCFLNRWFPLAVAIALGMALPWYWAAYQENGQVFLDMLVFHNVNRFSETVSGHNQPVYFFFVVLLVGFLPWSAYLPAAAKYAWQEIPALLKTRAEGVESRLLLFSVVWVIFILLFFTASGTKLLTYVLPFFPGLALWMGLAWHRAANERGHFLNRWIGTTSFILCAAVAIVSIVALSNFSALLPREMRGVALDGGVYNYLVIVMAVLAYGAYKAGIVFRRFRNPEFQPAFSALVSIAGSLAVAVAVAMFQLVPALSAASQGQMLAYLEKTGGKPLMIFEIQRPSLTFYGKRRIPRLSEDDGRELQHLLNTEPRWYVITKTKHQTKLEGILPTGARLRALEKGPVYSLLTISVPSLPVQPKSANQPVTR